MLKKDKKETDLKPFLKTHMGGLSFSISIAYHPLLLMGVEHLPYIGDTVSLYPGF